MTRLVVGPFNRVEGDLEVQLDVADGFRRFSFPVRFPNMTDQH